IELGNRFRLECGAAFDVLHIILQNSAQVSDVLPRWPMIGSTRLRLLALHSSSVSHACTPKLERRTRCRYSPRSRRATGPCCQSKPRQLGQDCPAFPTLDCLLGMTPKPCQKTLSDSCPIGFYPGHASDKLIERHLARFANIITDFVEGNENTRDNPRDFDDLLPKEPI